MGEVLRARTVICVLVSSAGLLRAGEPWGPGDSDICFSEIHYHPPGDEKSQEFVELHNAGVHWVDLGGWSFSSGIELTIPPVTVIEPGGYLVIARDAAALKAARKVSNVLGDWKGSLKNSGGILELRNRTGRAVASLRYRDGRGEKGGLWPESPDGDGPSLELIQPHPDWHRPWYWAPSRVPGGTPGRENSRSESGAARKPGAKPEARRLRLNEVRLEDEGAFVEILNDGEAPERLDGLKLTCGLLGEGGVSLSGSIPRKKHHMVPAEALGPLLAQLGPAAKGKPAPRPRLFLLTVEGLEILDTAAARRGAATGGSFGRFPDGEGALVTCAKATPGAPNPPPPPSDVVIHEIHYNSAAAPGEEFIELFNKGKAAASLEGWQLERAVSFEFPGGASIPAGGFVVAASDPEKVRARVPAAGRAQVFGPFKGKLSNSGDVVVLSDASGDEADKVEYTDRAPWPAEADGGGFSIELIDPALDNRWPQAWTTGGAEGTPCQKGARAIKSMPPAIGGVRHAPAVPGPEDGVLIHAQVVDTGSISSVSVVYRDFGSRSGLVKKAMADGGKLEDGAARDGHYTVRLPRFRAGTLVGYAIVARDGSGREARAPEAPDREFLFQVEDPRTAAPPAVGMPVYRILMPPTTWELFLRNRQREARFPCTFIASIEGPGVNEREGRVFPEASIRYRGNNSFNPPDGRMSYRLFLEGGKRHDGRDRLILNALDSFRQKAAGDVMRMAGLLVSNTDVIRLKTPTFDDSRYVDVEVINNEFLDDKFGSSAGRIFRGMNGADLADHGAEAARYLSLYVPVNKKNDPDLQSLRRLLQALDTRDPQAYADQVEKVLDPAEWAAYFAANHVVGNNERGLNSGVADDYFLAERPSDGKYVLVAWDQNETYLRPTLAPFTFAHGRLRAATRFVEHPRFAPLYHRAIREIIDGPFSRTTFARWKACYEKVFRVEDMVFLERFVTLRQTFLRSRYPVAPRAGVQPEGQAATSGFGTRTFLASGEDAVLVQGLADPALAFHVKVAGVEAEYDPVRGHWSWRGEQGLFAPGPNALWVESIGPGAEPADAYPINIERVPEVHVAPASIEGKAEWTRENGPVLLRGNVVIPPGGALRIGPGVDVVCAPGSSLTVRGTLRVEGAALEPVTFRPASRQGSWFGIRFLRGGKGSSLLHCRFEGGQAVSLPAGDVDVSEEPVRRAAPGDPQGSGTAFLRVEGSRLVLERCVLRGIEGIGLHASDAELEARGLALSACEIGLASSGGTLRIDGVVVSDAHATGMVLSGLEGESVIRGAVIDDVQGTGIAIDGGKVAIEGSLVHGCASGLVVSGGAKARIARTTFAGNAQALVVDPPEVVVRSAPPRRPVPVAPGRPPPPRATEPSVVIAPADSTSDVDASDSIFGPNLEHIVASEASRATLRRTILAPLGVRGEPPRGEDVVVAAPRFVAPERGDFRLEKGSPGKGKGPGGADPGWPGEAAR